jgi:catechol 2,3-dioxygenase-like lactoylglutathione lyase family enzyme
MEHIIAKLLGDFESGKMTRRQLIQSLTVAATAASAAFSAPAVAATPENKGFKAIAVNHISYEVADYAKTRDFYSDLLGMKVLQDNGKQCFLAFGETFLIPRPPRQADKPPYVDHFAITIENWNKDVVEAELNRRGLEPKPDTKDSFHIKDPNGYDLQICGSDMKP